MKRALLTLTILAVAISSCTIEKRLHRGGWHVEWKGNYRNSGDDKKAEKPEGELAETSTQKETIRPTEVPTVRLDKTTNESKATETTKTKSSPKVEQTPIEETSQVIAETVPTEVQPATAPNDAVNSDEVATKTAEKSQTAAIAKPADGETLPVDPLMIAAYIISGVILLGLLLWVAAPIFALSFGIGTGFATGWIFTLGYLFAAVANVILLGFVAVRKDPMRDTYRYLPTWPVWLVTFLPLFLAFVALILILALFAW